MNRIKLLAIDMDGTCLNSRKRVSPGTLRALNAAHRRGIEVVPTTGRALRCLPHQIEGWGFHRYVISSNGAKVTDVRSGEALFERLMDREQALTLLERCDLSAVGASAHIDDEFLLQGRPLWQLGRIVYGRQDASKARAVHSLKKLVQNCTGVEELQFFFFSAKARSRVAAALADVQGLAMAYGGNYVEICDAGATKGAALAVLAQQLGISHDEIACIGDSENDLSMFDTAGLRFAVGNAVPELKARADVVLPDNDHDGVAAAIGQLLLPEQREGESA
ncbi:MAG: HAD family hydrolase [Aristaeellaceae bacterium]